MPATTWSRLRFTEAPCTVAWVGREKIFFCADDFVDFGWHHIQYRLAGGNIVLQDSGSRDGNPGEVHDTNFGPFNLAVVKKASTWVWLIVLITLS